MFADCGKDGRKKKIRKQTQDAKDEGNRGLSEERKDGELKEAEEDERGDRGTLGEGRGNDPGVSWDLLVFFFSS